MKTPSKIFGMTSFAMLMLLPQSSSGVPVAVDPGIISLTTFDSGGFLDPIANGGFTLGGLEVDPVSGKVFVLGSDGGTGATSTAVQLIGSTGAGTAAAVGAVVPFKLNARGYDLTQHPSDGKLYTAGTLSLAGPVDGIHGFDPAGIGAPVTFATTSSGFATSGLTFNAAGTSALVTTDGVDTAVLPNGLYSVPAFGPEVLIVGSAALPTGVGATDDHVVTLDGRTIVAGDGSHDLWDATGGAGLVSLLIDLDTIPAVLPALGALGGDRATLDPWSGDIFYAHALTPGSPGIIRIKADGSAATVFALGFAGLRDIDFGPASSGSGGGSIYATEVDIVTGVGSIYEFEITHVPEPSTLILLLMGVVTLGLRGRCRRRR